jgi:hypothetical protein
MSDHSAGGASTHRSSRSYSRNRYWGIADLLGRTGGSGGHLLDGRRGRIRQVRSIISP